MSDTHKRNLAVLFLLSLSSNSFPVREWYYYFMEIFTVKDLSKLIKEKRLALGITQSDASATFA